MKELQIIKGVECYVDENGVVQLNLEHVARGLGFTRIAESGNEVIRWERLNKYLTEFGVPTCGHGDFIPEPIFYLLAMKAENQTARDFQKVVAYDILPTIRKHGMYAIDELLDDPDLLIEAATKLKAERRRRAEAEREKKRLEAELDRSKDWYSIKRVAALNGVDWKSFKWRKLKEASVQVGIPARKIFDANYGEVNVYHAKAWETAYPNFEI